MQGIYLLLSVFLVTNAVAKDEKKYTEEEYDKAVKEEVSRQIGLIKKKSITDLTRELLEKEESLNEREKTLNHREEQLKISEASLAKRITEFEGVKTKIIGCMDENQNAQAMRVKQLVSVISGMKPLKAAELLSVQQPDISVKIIQKIDPVRASKIFNLMDKEVSARLQRQYLNMQQ